MMRRQNGRFFLVASALAALFGQQQLFATAMVHDLTIENDGRSLYRIESFCFVAGGVLNLSVTDFHVDGATKDHSYRVGFAMRRANSESAAQQELEESLEAKTCLLDWKSTEVDGDATTVFELDMSDASSWKSKEHLRQHKISADEEGLYSLIFVRCKPSSNDATTSFKLHASFSNPGPAYLSACESRLPILFAVFCGLYFLALVVWGVILLGRKCFGDAVVKTQVHSIHWMMGLLLLFKTVSMFSQSLRYHYLNQTGTGEGWQFVYYVFASLKGVLLFVVIMLIGTGWSLVKPYLNDREKKVILVVLCLQVVDNIALVIFEETTPGSQRWLTWRDVLHLVDIVCCCAILFPIVWSIRHLRQAAAADGKTRNNIAKLTLFRQFYILVVSYVYFTRIVVFLLAATMPFELLWLRYLFTETATLLFYTVTGYKFRPMEDNPYLMLDKDDESPNGDLEEFGLNDDSQTATPSSEAAASLSSSSKNSEDTYRGKS